MEREAVHNFNPGPAALPDAVLQRAQSELLNFGGTGMSVMEMSHRSAAYDEIHANAIARLRRLMGIPEDYHVLFLQGGASTQFAMIPMNFLAGGQAAYVLTGSWAEKAHAEARKFGETRVAASTKEDGYRRIPSVRELDVRAGDAYLHVTSNNTIVGSQWKTFPSRAEMSAVPLVADMSSDILSRPVDVRDFDLIYAGAQKNLGPSGVTLVVIRDDLLQKAGEGERADRIPTMLQYGTHVKGDSRYNTPPVFGIYVMGLMLEWLEDQGGVAAIAAVNRDKAGLVYQAIDDSAGFYRGVVNPESRSDMNVTFRLPTPELEKQFVRDAAQQGLVGLGGHRSVGGIRASLYNAVPKSACEALVSFMKKFQQEMGA